MPPSLLDLPGEVLAEVFKRLDLDDLFRVANTCHRFRRGDGALETAELPTNSPLVRALREHAFPRPELVPRMLPTDRESWIGYLARCARQRRCHEELPIAAGMGLSIFVDASGRLLTCGEVAGHAYVGPCQEPTLVDAMARVKVRSVSAGPFHSLALGWDGRVYSWGGNDNGELGLGDRRMKPSPEPVPGLSRVCAIAAGAAYSLGVTETGQVFSWGRVVLPDDDVDDELIPNTPDMLVPTLLTQGFGGARMRRVCAGEYTYFAIGEEGEVYSWGSGDCGVAGHGDEVSYFSPARVEALRGVQVSSVAAGQWHAVALSKDGRVYSWGKNERRTVLGNPDVERELLPQPVEALRGVRVASIAAADHSSYAVADTGELWAWGAGRQHALPLGHGGAVDCPVPKPIESLRRLKIDAVATAGHGHTLALAGDGSVYTWGTGHAATSGALGLGSATIAAGKAVRKPRRIPGLNLACGAGGGGQQQ